MPILSLSVDEVVLENRYVLQPASLRQNSLSLKVKLVTESAQIIVLNPNGRLRDFPIVLTISGSDPLTAGQDSSSGSLEFTYNDFKPSENYYIIKIEVKLSRLDFDYLTHQIQIGQKLDRISINIKEGFDTKGELDTVWDIHLNPKVTLNDFRVFTKIQAKNRSK